MKSKTAVVTGSSGGFGLLISLELALRGFYVVATMRNIEKGSELINKAKEMSLEQYIKLIELDVTREDSILTCKSYLEESCGSIDILVNNAGYAGAGFAEEVSIQEFRKQFETNVFGVMSVTQAILPLMRRKKAGKIINMSSISGKIGFPGLSPYSASKHALEGYSESLRLELRDFGIDVVLVEPGSFKTNIWTTGKQVAESSLNQNSPYFKMMERIEAHLHKASPRYGNPIDVARLIGDIAENPKPKLRYQIGKGVKATLALKAILPWWIWEKLLLKQLK
ncbi:short-subunit dehydrogenase [Bacillus oleivorans]|uniref:Short-subunit dehydrogenase n=1 Tax=Bacillus oleivorans TaxID=1448271 RepID=A0A285CHI5_9BACI|nr:SDR family oxidoreductase [Bacillus oleivorans]SNX66805.1 short-subunit dehydrogenase [Bacillus oleivorans]